MGRPKRPVWSDDKYKTNADYFGFQDELTEWGDKAEAYMDAQAEIIKGLEVDLEDTRKALLDLKTIALEKAKTIKRLREEMIEHLESLLMYEQDACLNTGDTEQRIRDLRTACLKEEKHGPTETD